jgi:hypothetical protein
LGPGRIPLFVVAGGRGGLYGGRMKPIFLSVVAFFLGIWLYSSGADDRKLMAQYQDEGETVPGEIISGEIQEVYNGRRGPTYNYILKVSFTTLDQKLFNKKFMVSRSFFNSVGKDGVIMKPSAKVIYLKNSPSDAIIKGGTSFRPELQWLGPLISLAAAGFLWYRLRKTLADDNYDHG